MGEQVRVAQSAPPDHDQIHAGLFIHAYSGFCRIHVAVADDRDGNGFFHRLENLPVGAGSVHLLTGAAVDSHRRGAALLRHFGEFHRVDRLGVPASAEFGSHRNGHRPHHRLGDPPGKFRVFHQGAAAAVARHFRCGAAHIDINDIRLIGHRHFGGAGHSQRIVAKQLDAAGMFRWAEG